VLTLNSSGVRDISRILKINKNTVISELKKTPNLNLYILDMVEDKRLKKLNIEFYYTADPDESWSFVGNKSNQRWTWYAVDKNSGIILDRYNGKRTDEVFLKLVALLSLIPIGMYFTDDWGAYKRYLPENRHYIGKDRIWKIERKNLNFGTHIKRLNRKPICYSRNEHIHDNVTGMYIEQYYFKSGLFLNSA
jgi:insertion element IS1 protein InsB